MADNPEIDVTIPCAAWRDAVGEVEDVCRRAALAVLDIMAPNGGPIEVSIVLSDDDFIRSLNREFRGRDEPTDVLSFSNEEPNLPDRDERPVLLGDVVVAFQTASRDASADGLGLAGHLSHLVVHGMLHLFGFDHEIETDAARMERQEMAVLATLGVANPYATPVER